MKNCEMNAVPRISDVHSKCEDSEMDVVEKLSHSAGTEASEMVSALTATYCDKI